MKFKNKALAFAGTGIGSMVVTNAVYAENLAADATAKIAGDGIDTTTAVGLGMLSMAVVAVIFKWAKGGVFG